MISKLNRFHGRNALNNVYRKGQAAKSDFMSLRYADNGRSDYRMAVVVSKKVSKSAVVRNRIRRRIYEVVRLHKKEKDIAWKKDIVVSVFDERIATMPPEELKNNLLRLLAKAGL